MCLSVHPDETRALQPRPEMQEYRPDEKTTSDDTARHPGAVPFYVDVDTPFGPYPVNIGKFRRSGDTGASQGKRKRFPGAANPFKPSAHVHVRRYRRGDWLTTEGVAIKRREIEAKGLPSFFKWRMQTLSLSREKFGHDPLAGYLAGAAKIRKYMFRCRKLGLFPAEAKWCWKLEFQADGWAHWHLFVSRTAKFSKEEMAKLNKVWGLGRVNNKMIRNNNFDYQFKYAFKPALAVSDDDDGGGFDPDDGQIPWVAPAWFLDFTGVRTVRVQGRNADGSPAFDTFEAEKPVSFQGVRFWQTSKGFYTGVPRKLAGPSKPPVSCRVPRSVRREVIARRCAVQVVARKRWGRYVASGVVQLSSLTGLFWDHVGWDAIHGEAVGLAVGSYVVPTDTLKRKTDLCSKSKLHSLLSQNRLDLAAARHLRRHKVTLQTC